MARRQGRLKPAPALPINLVFETKQSRHPEPCRRRRISGFVTTAVQIRGSPPHPPLRGTFSPAHAGAKGTRGERVESPSPRGAGRGCVLAETFLTDPRRHSLQSLGARTLDPTGRAAMLGGLLIVVGQAPRTAWS